MNNKYIKCTSWAIVATIERPDGTWYTDTITEIDDDTASTIAQLVHLIYLLFILLPLFPFLRSLNQFPNILRYLQTFYFSSSCL